MRKCFTHWKLRRAEVNHIIHMYRETTQFHHLFDFKDQNQNRSLEASWVLSLSLKGFHCCILATSVPRVQGYFKLNLNRTQAAMTEQWPIDEDLMTTHSRRNEPLRGVFQTCMISTRIESIEQSAA
jgi:hypothetical protein